MVGLSPNTKYTFTLQQDNTQTRVGGKEFSTPPTGPDIPQIRIDDCDGQTEDLTSREEETEVDLVQEQQEMKLEDTNETTLEHEAAQIIEAGDEEEEELEEDEQKISELEGTFRTEKCGKHDARLIAAIENHDMTEVRRICSQSPEVIN